MEVIQGDSWNWGFGWGYLTCNFFLKIYVQFYVYVLFFLVGLVGTHSFQIFNTVQSS